MQITQIIQILNNKVITLREVLKQAIGTGDIQRVSDVEIELQLTLNSLAVLNSLPLDDI